MWCKLLEKKVKRTSSHDNNKHLKRECIIFIWQKKDTNIQHVIQERYSGGWIWNPRTIKVYLDMHIGFLGDSTYFTNPTSWLHKITNLVQMKHSVPFIWIKVVADLIIEIKKREWVGLHGDSWVGGWEPRETMEARIGLDLSWELREQGRRRKDLKKRGPGEAWVNRVEGRIWGDDNEMSEERAREWKGVLIWRRTGEEGEAGRRVECPRWTQQQLACYSCLRRRPRGFWFRQKKESEEERKKGLNWSVGRGLWAVVCGPWPAVWSAGVVCSIPKTSPRCHLNPT